LGGAYGVRFLCELPHPALAALSPAGDAMVLASSREGWANVLLESMACGTPVVAADVNGTAEVVRSQAAGLLIPERSAAGIAETLGRLRAHMPSREATRRYAEDFGWSAVGRANHVLLSGAARLQPGEGAEIVGLARRCLDPV
jgi:glycosyltransferase involved in cell wall biosynthesis